MKKIIIIQPSLRKQSYTHTVCDLVIKECAKRNDLEVQYIDLRERELEFCDGRDISKYNADLQGDYTSIKGSDIVIMGFPLYHFSVSGVLKNYLDIMGDALQDKKIDFLVNAIFPGGEFAYEHILESFGEKYSVTKASKNTPYILNDMFKGSMLVNLPARKKLQDFVSSL